MTSERKEPHLTDLDHAGSHERIPTLSERVAPDLFSDWEEPAASGDQRPGAEPPADANLAAALDDDDAATPRLDDYDFIEELTREDDSEPEPAAERNTAPEMETGIRPEDIEALSDRVLDQIAPALREAVAAAVTELLAGKLHDPD